MKGIDGKVVMLPLACLFNRISPTCAMTVFCSLKGMNEVKISGFTGALLPGKLFFLNLNKEQNKKELESVLV